MSAVRIFIDFAVYGADFPVPCCAIVPFFDKSSYAAHSFTNGVCECGYVQSGSSDEGTDGEINNNPVADSIAAAAATAAHFL